MPDSAVDLLPSQLWVAKPNERVSCSSNPYSGVKKNSQMFATAIIGSTVGVKYARRSRPRPANRPLTQSAMASAITIDSGIVPSAYQRLLVSDCQKIGSSTSVR